ncbi:MAG: hypothetical protein K9G48_08560 [Reyranella sp.]|nr:hypothetical protein [Reyranella sp.]
MTAATAGANRRLVTAATVRALIGSPAGDDTTIEGIIDRACSLIAGACHLARGLEGTPPNFGAESVRATWPKLSGGDYRRGTRLFLPWRVPITAITAASEDGTALTAASDVKLLPGGLLERRSDGAPICWSSDEIVVTYTVGWELQTPNTVPPDLEGACIEQVRMMYLGRKRDGALLSENAPDMYGATYGVAGGTGIGRSGLLLSVEGALIPYMNPASR